MMRGSMQSAMALLAASWLSACTSTSPVSTAPKPSAQAAPAQPSSASSTSSGMGGGASYYTTNASAPSRKSASRTRPDRGAATRNAKFVEEGAAHTEVYPKFVPPHPATTQMTDAEKKAFEAQMAARIKTNKAPAESPAEYQERLKLMRALAEKHGSETLQEIKQ